MTTIDTVTKNFEPGEAEARLYRQWQEQGLFAAQVDKNKKPYTIVMPPPNITGQLHMGHALDNTLQDILIRWRRMQGYEALWQPGTDHASIATEARIVAALKEEGLSKEALGREKFLERAWDWKAQYGGRIVEQLKRLGSSCDWSRERFTMDDGLSRAVRKVFVDLYEKGLIYRGKRMINWCPHCLTTISDVEVEYEEQDSSLWHIRYPFAHEKGYVVIATTRPETMLGDTAVAVNPQDERYQKIVGKTVRLPLTNREIPIIADDYVESEFGTGVVKITPAHDPNDYEIGLRHQLGSIDVMTDDGHISEAGGRYAGATALEARKQIVEELKAQGLLEKIEPYKHNVGTCSRCHTTVDPRLSLQWFVSMNSLAEPAIRAVEEGQTRFVPARFEKIYFNWLHNIRDWCISRQLWWGHRIPAYYCLDCGGTTVSVEPPEHCSHCGSPRLRQDEDTLDTWFSSALWPFSTLGWPDKTPDYEYFYPTDTLVTGPDIIFFWVARMIFSALEQTGQTPFKTVYLHGIVRDNQGRKMSKSLNNGIDPLEVIDQYGADALRYALVDGSAPGSDQRYRPDKIEAGRAFINKIWNAFRFVLQNLDGTSTDGASADTPVQGEIYSRVEDRWILSRLKTLEEELTQNLERFEFGVALAKIHAFVWDEYCDWYIEMVKPRLRDKEAEGHKEAQDVLLTVLSHAVRLLHPFMPFFTEEIYRLLPNTEGSVMISRWPDGSGLRGDPEAEAEVAILTDVIRQIRSIRLKLAVPPSKRAQMFLVTVDEGLEALFADSADYFERLAGISEVHIRRDTDGLPEKTVTALTAGGTVYLPLAELVDLKKERKRLADELARTEKQIASLKAKLANQAFVDKAPKTVVANERAKLETQAALEARLRDRLAELV